MIALGAWLIVTRLPTLLPEADETSAATPTAVAQPTPTGAAAQPTVTPQGESATVAVPVDARPAEVRWIHDGDSFDVRFLDDTEPADDEIRLWGLDTPEPGACFANEARDSLIALLKGRQVMVQADWDGGRFSDGRDQYFRLIANVWLDERLINVDQVRSGYATARSSDNPYKDQISAAQQHARDNAAGLWANSACGGSTQGVADTDRQLAIVELTADAPGRDDENPNGEWIDIANAGSTPVEMQGWSLRDESTRNRFSFPQDFVLAGNATVKVRSGCGSNTATELFWCAETPVWTNGADTAYLVQPDGRFHDVLSYTSN